MVSLIVFGVLGFIGFMILLYVLRNTFVLVGGTQIAIVERKLFGKSMPQGRVIAQNNEVGIQARTLGPGFHMLIPFLYSVRKEPFTVIPESAVGVVESIDGEAIPPGRIFGMAIAGHNSFQDGERFLANGGQKGPQMPVIPPGTYRINPKLFKVSQLDVIRIGAGQIGTIVAKDGAEIPSGRLLAHSVQGHNSFQDGQAFIDAGGQKGPQIDVLLPGTYRINTNVFSVSMAPAVLIPAGNVGVVTARDGSPLPPNEYVATSVEGHNDYQNGSAFLAGGGQRGPQLDVLKPGTYYINPLLFSVELDEVATVERGQVAVVVSNVGRELTTQQKQELAKEEEVDPNGIQSDFEKYVVPAGYRGIQKDVAGPGIYYLNRRAFMAYVVDTTNITIDWDEAGDTKFNSLQVISKDGFPIKVSVKVIIRVRPDQAPYMIAKIGSVENLVSHVIHPMIDSSFRNQASSTSAMNFMQDRQDEQKKAEDRARVELEKYHVECVSVLICQIELPIELMNTQTERIIAEQQKAMYEEQQKAQQTRIATEKTKAQADQQGSLVTAEIGVQIASQTKQRKITEAEGDAEAVRLQAIGQAAGIEATGKAEASKIKAIGEATADAYRLQVNALGQDGVMAVEVTKKIAEGNIKVTPDFLVQGDNVGGLLSAFLAQKVSANGKKEQQIDIMNP